MLALIRLYTIASLTQAGYLYAAWTVLRSGKREVQVISSSEVSGAGAAAGSTVASRERFTLDTACLKLCIMVTAAACLELLGADAFPLFPEMRVITMYLLLFAPLSTQREVYDKAFSPLLVKLGNSVTSLNSSDFLTKRIILFLVRRFVALCIAMMNYVDRCGTLEQDAIKDILGGLVFSRRALDDVAASEREADKGSPTFAASLMSTFSGSGSPARAVLQEFTSSLASSIDSFGSTAGLSSSGTAGPSNSLFSSSEEVQASPAQRRHAK